ncbi:MAG: RNA-guided endonuclease TnpB family protein [Elusimicrobiota bacterium]
MKVNKAYRYELDPNNIQKTLLAKHSGVARFAYNWGLARRIQEYKTTGKSSNAIEQHRQINALKKTDFPWMYEVSKCAPQEALRDLECAYKNFFRRVKNGERLGFPKFKKKGIDDSFRLTGSISVLPRHIQLPRLGAIRTKESTHKFTGKILSAVVKREADKWFVSLAVEVESPDPKPIQGEICGCDLGLNKFVQISNGEVIDFELPLAKLLSKLKEYSRSHSKKQKGSNNRRKSAVRLARIHYRIKCLRKDTIHKITTLLAKTKSVICVEDLNVKGMIKNSRLARSISDASWGELVKQLEYKCMWYGSTLVFAPAKFPSTKMCNRCKNVKESMLLSERTYRCDKCGLVIDRDLNSAINLENHAREVIGHLNQTTASSAGRYACGDGTSTGEIQQALSLKQEESTSITL